MTVAKFELQPAFIQAATVVDVDPARAMMTLRTDVGERGFYNVPIPSPYVHPFSGEGVHIIPEPGAQLWVAIPSEGDARPVPLIYKPIVDAGGGHRANRSYLNPGDIELSTRDNNHIRVRRGGMVEITSTPLARTVYIPTNNEICTFFENYRLDGLPGSLKWSTCRGVEDPDGKNKAQLTISAKEFANERQPAVRIEAGSISRGDEVLSISVFKDSTVRTEDDLDASLKVTGNRDGELKIRVATGGQLAVFNNEANTEGVVLGKTFLTDLSSSLTEISGLLAGLALPTPNTLALVAKITTSLATAKGQAPYLSIYTRTE